MLKVRIVTFVLLIFGIAVGVFVYQGEQNEASRFQFKFGLDLSGGTHLVYRADTSQVDASQVKDAMDALRDVIERRVNLFGVGEPIVQTERGGALAGDTEERLIVELPGVTDTERAIAMIGETPSLEFRLLKKDAAVPEEGVLLENINDFFQAPSITGKHIKRAELQFGQGGSGFSNEPVVVLNFNTEGKQIFADLTRANVGEIFGIFLDGVPISTPVIREAIPDGTAVISGNFTPESARELVRNLNYGALPLPIELLTTETVGGTLGDEAVKDGLMAGLYGVGAVILFMILWYRLPGLIASCALLVYIIISLALFKLIPVTLTSAGIAAFILSIGMAVDANILIFERMKEELRAGKNSRDAIRDGFARAWLSIRDSNISSMITAVILFWFSTSLIKGFALVFGLGVLVSMLTAISVSRTFLLALGIAAEKGFSRFLFGSGMK